MKGSLRSSCSCTTKVKRQTPRAYANSHPPRVPSHGSAQLPLLLALGRCAHNWVGQVRSVSLTNPWRRLGRFAASVLQIRGVDLARSRRQLDEFAASSWQVRGASLTSPRRQVDKFAASTWQARGQILARPRLELGRSRGESGETLGHALGTKSSPAAAGAWSR